MPAQTRADSCPVAAELVEEVVEAEHVLDMYERAKEFAELMDSAHVSFLQHEIDAGLLKKGRRKQVEKRHKKMVSDGVVGASKSGLLVCRGDACIMRCVDTLVRYGNEPTAADRGPDARGPWRPRSCVRGSGSCASVQDARTPSETTRG